MRRIASRLAAAVLGAILLAFVGVTLLIWYQSSGESASPRATGDEGRASGIRGTTVFVSGPCDSFSCPPEEPIRAKQEVRRDGSGELVREFTSSGDGRFEVSLPPGRYMIVQSMRQRRPGSLAPVFVSVKDGEFVDLKIAYDGGMR